MTKQIPQGYKQTQVGVIPEDWEVVKLNEVVNYISRAVPKPRNGYWRLGLRSHAKGTFHEYIDDTSKIQMDTLYEVKNNDLIVNITFAWEHAIAVAEADDEGKLVSHRFPTYEFKYGCYYNYYKYYFLQQNFKLLLEHISPGGAGRNRVMSKKDFLNLHVLKPSIKEQEKIAEILMMWDEAITKQTLLIEQKQLFKKGLMQQIFSQKLCFKDEKGNNYPAWQTKKIGDTLKVKHGKDQKKVAVANGQYPILGTSGEIGRANSYLYNKPSVLIGRKGTINKPQYMDTPFWTVDTLFYSETADNCFAKWMFYKFETIDWLFYNEASGVPSLSATTISNIKLQLPSLPEQIKIANFLTLVDDEISKLIDELEQFKLQKKALMQKLLTGEIRVVT